MKKNPVPKIVFIRIDKIGDLICTLPVDQIPALKNVQKNWVISAGLEFIPQSSPIQREVFSLNTKKSSKELTQDLRSYLSKEQPDIVISFYSPWWVGLACFQAKVPLRVTRYSQWHSFIFFNCGVRQKRTRAEKHEADYNLDLVQKALQTYRNKYAGTDFDGVKNSDPLSANTSIQISDSNFPTANQTLSSPASENEKPSQHLGSPGNSLAVTNSPSSEIHPSSQIQNLVYPYKAPVLEMRSPVRRNLFERLAISPQKYIVIHPGMAGSALNWPQTSYNQLIEKLVDQTVVVITGTDADSPYLTEIKPKWEFHPRVRFVQGKLSIEELLALIHSANALLAPSTGVLHLAASLGKAAFGIYSPISTHHPRRWGPRGKHTEIFLPHVECPALTRCEGNQCPHYPCMEKISTDEVFLRLKKGISND